MFALEDVDADYDWHAIDALAVELRMFATIVLCDFPSWEANSLGAEALQQFAQGRRTLAAQKHLFSMLS